MTVDWSRWMKLTEEQQQAMRAAYRDRVASERDANKARWARMSPAEKVAYPRGTA